MNHSTLITIDPGASGAVVIRSCDGMIRYVASYDGHETILSAVTKATMSPSKNIGVAALIERVWASPVMGKSSAFAFGGNYEGWIVGLKVAGIPVFGVTPQEWHKAVVPTLGAAVKRAVAEKLYKNDYDASKALLKQEAIDRFVGENQPYPLPPGVKVTLKNCDALVLSDLAIARNQSGQPLGLAL